MLTRRRALGATGLALAAAPIAATRGWAQGAGAWPSGPIRIVSPFPPGGSTDALSRLLQPHLQREFGVPVVVENRAGASGALGTAAVARAQPDGNSWVLVFDTHAVNPALIANLGFDTQRDLAPVLLFGTAPMLVCAHQSRPWKTMAEAVAAAKARPESLTFGSIGNGSLAHLTMELAGRAGGFRMVHVPYRGGGPIQTAAVAGEVDLAVATPSVLIQHVQAGTLRALAQTGAERSASLPDIPTLAEGGIPGVDARAFWGFLGTGGTPAPVVARMEAALRRALEVPEVRERFAALRIDLAPQGPQEFRGFLDRQIETWGRVVRENNIRPD
jgi:tripartite-type tricarboxylate transporter receptor subunit TctC